MLDILLAIWTAVGAGIIGLIVWYVRIRHETNQRENERVYDERRKIYLQIIEPTIHIFANAENPSAMKKVEEQITSLEHRRAMFELNLMGSDDVVRAMNVFMQHAFHSTGDSVGLIAKWSELLLAIRKDLGNKRTSIKPVEMLRSQITDIDKYMDSSK